MCVSPAYRASADLEHSHDAMQALPSPASSAQALPPSDEKGERVKKLKYTRLPVLFLGGVVRFVLSSLLFEVLKWIIFTPFSFYVLFGFICHIDSKIRNLMLGMTHMQSLQRS